MKIEDVMTKELIVGYVPGTVKDALKTLAQNNVSGIPILKKGTDKLAGVVTREDIFKNPEEDQIAMVLCEDYQYINKDQDITDAAKKFLDYRIHGLPVVDKGNNLVGIISPYELLKILVKEEKNDIVKNHVSQMVVPVYFETPIDIIMEIINITRENALPVLNEKRKVVGIVSDGDIIKLSEIKEEIKQSNMGLGSDEDQWTWEGIRDTVRMYHETSEVSLPNIPVKEVMVKDVKTATFSTPICEVAKTMVKNNISHVPIVDSENRLIGMITDIDLMQCLIS